MSVGSDGSVGRSATDRFREFRSCVSQMDLNFATYAAKAAFIFGCVVARICTGGPWLGATVGKDTPDTTEGEPASNVTIGMV
jgi:hypothetical protein